MRALVLGGSGTIGTAIVERLLEEGNEVIIQYFQSDLKALQDKYKGEAVEFIQADLTQNIDLETTFAHIKYLDCLIYSSGTALYGLLQDMSDIDIDLSYNIHVKQLIRCCRYFIDLIRQSEFGRIIVISSIWGETGASMETIYSAMKSAQIGFVKALSQELAMTNVTVNAITPGFVSGNMSQVFNSDELKAILEELPQQRMINPCEIAHTCAYLWNPLAKSITGTVQKVNGAWYI
ncbi:SDR family oxidoreductase [Staphylococcus sp. EG-SA-6]|jgi:3-oxoacyl-[acyl-carrier protein] reductase|uniref:SDR family NAD(P)-dependent oxidoreductase n=4 Tax=Bacillales TaxID=1385 RepID=A0A640MUY1_BACAN|nr:MULTISPECIES: SDR family oxidoreductase [Staphylococcus]KDP49580.1 KR domain protein [Staphylococcus aureus subsp. aureus CO-98]MBN4935390.1 SDR family oxidoreductase [Staphylococcus sp. EG-SA-6]MDU5816433.1 SDR family oxidoreductase [Staphylococcus sp.]GEU17723.1 SDR family NAD(P)-dependent oxidoreductase [Bacillus anthracis]AKC76427.1 3-oxoacyl-acyl carrier protein reductase [Staphylococcus haemolyticus]